MAVQPMTDQNTVHNTNFVWRALGELNEKESPQFLETGIFWEEFLTELQQGNDLEPNYMSGLLDYPGISTLIPGTKDPYFIDYLVPSCLEMQHLSVDGRLLEWSTPRVLRIFPACKLMMKVTVNGSSISATSCPLSRPLVGLYYEDPGSFVGVATKGLGGSAIAFSREDGEESPMFILKDELGFFEGLGLTLSRMSYGLFQIKATEGVTVGSVLTGLKNNPLLEKQLRARWTSPVLSWRYVSQTVAHSTPTIGITPIFDTIKSVTTDTGIFVRSSC